MHRIGNIWDKVVSLDNLDTAYYKARRGKRRRPDVARFALELEQNLSVLQQELITGAYTPGAYALRGRTNIIR